MALQGKFANSRKASKSSPQAQAKLSAFNTGLSTIQDYNNTRSAFSLAKGGGNVQRRIKAFMDNASSYSDLAIKAKNAADATQSVRNFHNEPGRYGRAYREAGRKINEQKATTTHQQSYKDWGVYYEKAAKTQKAHGRNEWMKGFSKTAHEGEDHTLGAGSRKKKVYRPSSSSSFLNSGSSGTGLGIRV